MNEEIFLAKMTWPEVQLRSKKCDIVVIPVGSCEQHGPALPLDTDVFIPSRIAEEVATALEDEVEIVVAPPIHFGFSLHHIDFPGTISLKENTFVELVVEVCESLHRSGFRKIVLLNGHGGNAQPLHAAIYRLKSELKGLFIAVVTWWEMAGEIIKEVMETSILYHADEIETSMAWALGSNVRDGKLTREFPKALESKFIKINLFAKPPIVKVPIRIKEISDSGVVGDSTKASVEKGNRIVNVLMERLIEFLKELDSIEI